MKKLTTLFLALVASAGTMFAWDYERVQIDGLYYNLDATNHTASVTDNSDIDGDIIIPSSVIDNEITYIVRDIEESAFFGCFGLTSITIGSNITRIGDMTFFGCFGLTSIEIPSSVTSIGENVFSNCSNLTSINVVEDNLNYSSLDGVFFNKDQTILIQYPGGKKGAYTIPGSVTSIENKAFTYCNYLTSVEIPSSVTSIGKNAFSSCTELTAINIADNLNYCSLDGVFFNKDQTTLIQYPGGKKGAYTIPGSVTGIGNGAFTGCIYLTSVEIPTSVTNIGEEAFSQCYRLADITIPNSVTNIGESAFDNCHALTSVTIPNSITRISNQAFAGCINLTSIEIPSSVTSIGWSAFGSCIGLKSVTIPGSVTSIGDAAFSYCSSLTSITNYATTPQIIESSVFSGDEYTPAVDKPTCVLYVPKESLDAYQTADVWKDFENIVGIDVPGDDPEDPIETITGDYTIYYVDKESQDLSDEVVTLHVPVAPTITGFTFVCWDVVAGHLTNGITIQAIYTADIPSAAPAVYTNPANPAQKLIKNGNVYILTEDKTYSIEGRRVK